MDRDDIAMLAFLLAVTAAFLVAVAIPLGWLTFKLLDYLGVQHATGSLGRYFVVGLVEAVLAMLLLNCGGRR